MATIKTLLGNVKGPKGDTGETGATGAPGAAATVEAGTVNTVAYGQPAHVTNVGTPQAAVFNFNIPEGRPGNIGEISGYPVNAITTQAGDFPIPNVGDTIASIVGKQAKATADARDGIQSALDAAAAASASIANVLGDFATIESTATASKPYEIGDRLVLNGLYYKVTAAISQGNALVVDGNIEKTTVGDDITALNKDLAISTDGIWTVRKGKNIAECWGEYNMASAAFSPDGAIFYRSSGNINFPAALFSSSPIVSITAVYGNIGAVTLSGCNASGINAIVMSATSSAREVRLQIRAIGKAA